ncbi:MAG: polysaccharide biosynthesis protein, partial [Lachnospiraceae bacterium]|nr:polysaccharide biosynthesis protein [Lachnospiraceae bacterium]
MSEEGSKKRKKIEHWKVIRAYLVLYDAFVVNFAYFGALWLRFDLMYSTIPSRYLSAWMHFTPFYTVIAVIVFWRLRLYNSIWRFASYNELSRVIGATIITTVIHTLGITVFFIRMPISYYLMGTIFQFIAVLGVRFAYRFILLLGKRRHPGVSGEATPVMLIGAGSAGQMILRDITRSKELNEKAVCIIDDNPNKWNRDVDGVPVVGGRDEIMAAAVKYGVKKIYLAIPSASMQNKRDILNICNETGCELKQLPGMYQLASGQLTVSNMKKVSVEDLLGRDPIRADMEEVFDFINGKVVLVTGGGGSIGSELCRQIAAHSPKQLIIFDIYENNAYDIQLELREKYPKLDLVTLIGSVRDSRKIFKVFEDYHPDIVYHAAAHKHVPL